MFRSSAKNTALKTLLTVLLGCSLLAHGTDITPPEAQTQLELVAMGSVKLVKRNGADGTAQLELLLPITFKPSPGCRIVAAQRISGEIEVVYRDASAKTVRNPGRYTYTFADAVKSTLTERPAIDAEVTIYFRLATQKVIDIPGYVWQADYNATKPLKIEVSESNERVADGVPTGQIARTSSIEVSDAGFKVAAKQDNPRPKRAN